MPASASNARTSPETRRFISCSLRSGEPEQAEDALGLRQERRELVRRKPDVLDVDDDGLAADAEDDHAEDIAVDRILIRVVPGRVRARAEWDEVVTDVVDVLRAGDPAVELNAREACDRHGGGRVVLGAVTASAEHVHGFGDGRRA